MSPLLAQFQVILKQKEFKLFLVNKLFIELFAEYRNQLHNLNSLKENRRVHYLGFTVGKSKYHVCVEEILNQ
jgi:hypothetical protein